MEMKGRSSRTPDLDPPAPCVRGGDMIREPKVGILVLNWNNWRDTIRCLESLRTLSFRNHQVILIDNGSGNDSVERLRNWMNVGRKSAAGGPDERGEDRFREGQYKGLRTLTLRDAGPFGGLSAPVIILTGKNLGYAGGNNAGMDYALDNGCQYVWILNSDTVADARALEELVKPAESDEKIGMVGSRLRNELAGPGESAPPGRSGSPSGIDVRYLSGASLLARAECVRDVGKIDEDFFLYGEEVDWCLRARKKGWKLLFSPGSIVVHEWGASTNSKRIVRRFLGREITRLSWEGFPIPGYYEARNGIYFVRKNRSGLLIPYSIVRTLHLLFQILLYDDHKVGRWKIVLRGARDGIRNRMGMTVDPSRLA